MRTPPMTLPSLSATRRHSESEYFRSTSSSPSVGWPNERNGKSKWVMEYEETH
jgi:hypothetical protein